MKIDFTIDKDLDLQSLNIPFKYTVIEDQYNKVSLLFDGHADNLNFFWKLQFRNAINVISVDCEVAFDNAWMDIHGK